MAEEDTWENRENLGNTKKLVEEFEREYEEEVEELRRQELEEEREFSWELPREFMAKLIYGWEKGGTKEKEKRGRIKLELIEKFLGTRKLEGGAIL